MQNTVTEQEEHATIMNPPDWAEVPENSRFVGALLSDAEFDIIRDMRLRPFHSEVRFAPFMRKLLLTGIRMHLYAEALHERKLERQKTLMRWVAGGEEASK
jgi:hypothetical protein